MAVNGENLVPSGGGRAGVGAAYVLGKTSPDALAILLQGQRARELNERQRALAQQKADEARGKELNDRLNYKVSGSHYFGNALQSQVYDPLNGQLVQKYKDNPNDSLARAAATRPLLTRTAGETQMADAKTKYLDDNLGAFKGDVKLYNPKYATEYVAKRLRDEASGREYLPSEVDEEAIMADLRGDHNLYNEGEVVQRTAKNLMPVISQRIAEAGQLGGQHTADQVRGRFVAFDGQGKPMLNADGSPKLNLTADTQALLESDPLFKLKVDAREATYNAQREKDPNLPVVSRRGHIAQMVGPMAYYSTQHDEGLNAPPRAARAGAKPGFTPNPVASYDGGVVGADVQTGSTQSSDPLFVTDSGDLGKYRTNQEQQPVMQQGFYSPVRRPQPTYATKSNPAKTYMFTGLPVTEMIRPGKNGALEVTKNNKNGVFGIPQQGVTIFRNRKTGAVELPPNNQVDHDARLAKLGPDWKLEGAVQTAVPINKNYANEIGPALARLEAREKQKAATDYGYAPKTSDQLEAEAFKLASGGTETQYLPYNPANAANIDAHTGGAFREFGTKIVPAKEREIRSKAPAAKPLYTPKPKAVPAAEKQASASPTGGLYTPRKR